MVLYDNFTISRALKRHSKSRAIFIDCVGADDIPTSDQFPYAVVVNTDNTLTEGTHWTAIFVPGPSVIEYFDSYGLPPKPNIKTYLDKFEVIHSNKYSIQSLFSTDCGAYAIYFIISRCAGNSFNETIRVLRQSSDPDKFVRSFCRALL